MMIRATLTTAFLVGIASVTMAYAQEIQTLSSYEPYSLAQTVRTPDDYEPYPLTQIADEMRYPAAEPPAGNASRHGEVEYLGHNVFSLHWYVEANDAVWHFVTGSDPNNEAILFIHGFPDTWWSWQEVMALLADDFYVIVADTLGYGRSDKRLELDLTYNGVAEGLEAFLDAISIKANIVSHEVLADHMIARGSMDGRILAYLRTQQSADRLHRLPRPQHERMATLEYQSDPTLIYRIFDGAYYLVDMPQSYRYRVAWEYGFPGTVEAVARLFESANFDKELEFRLAEVFPHMNMPTLFMQGANDPGQHLEEYWRTAEIVTNGQVLIVDPNHFIQAENPSLVSRQQP